ncbi:hypothetical protein SELMODRAFT_420334 [Selaginella moellendorffii]|uniref:Uncharacterized protein n=1 Tax=Selaginella moellendorffii TaxID=88036 RepID=D8SBN7_SELML|nr:hypothetical protein SELMODRAFT_420334 [Selaginella moellendorffii]
MRGIHMQYVVVVTLLSPHYAWSPTVFHSQLWKAKNKLWLPNSGCSKWLSAQCATWAASPPPGPSNDDEDTIARHVEMLALLGGEVEKSVTESQAQELLSSIRLLVPPTLRSSSYRSRGVSRVEKPERMWRKSVEWAGEPDAILAELDSALHKVPDVENSNASKCVLTKHDCAKRFVDQEINSYMAFLFEAIVALAPLAGFNVSVNCYDLFHGHMFTAYGTGRLGILFHCQEYPEHDKNNFALNLGYCQTGKRMPQCSALEHLTGSFVPYDSSMNLRNIIWLAPMPSCTSHKCSAKWLAPGALFILDAKPGGVVFKELVSEWVDVNCD